MTTRNYLTSRGFIAKGEQPVGATDYVIHAGVFRLRVRVPLPGYKTTPALWVGYTAGGPLVEHKSSMKHKSVQGLVEYAAALMRTLIGH